MMQNTFEKTIFARTLNINLSKLKDPTVSISTLCTDIFLIIISMREQQDLGTPESLRKLLKHYIQMLMQNCSEKSIDTKVAESVKFALIALIDETVLSIPGTCSTVWSSHPLQFEYYGEQIAGYKFYEDLEQLMANPLNNYEILETFYYCLSLGFQGKYLDDSEEREKVIRQLATVLINTRTQTRPLWKKPVAPPRIKKQHTAFIMPLWLAATITMVVVVSIWIGVSVATRSFSNKTIHLLTVRHSELTDRY
jgi:type VI secretion system protein ImpK